MNFGNYVFAASVTVVMGTLTVLYWLMTLATVDKLGSDTEGIFIVYMLAVLASVGSLHMIIRVWRD